MANFCEHCGAPLTVGVRFCEACGQPITPIVEQTSRLKSSSSSSPKPIRPAPSRRMKNILVAFGLIVGLVAFIVVGLVWWHGHLPGKSVVAQKEVSAQKSAPSTNSSQTTLTQGSQPAAPAMTIMGRLTWYGQQNRTYWGIEPWVICKDNNYTSIFVSWPNGNERANNAALKRRRTSRLPGTTFWLYDRGSEIGTLVVQSGVIPHTGESILPGKVSWKGKPLTTEEISNRKIIALSHPIPQNFWASQDRLTHEQLAGFRQLLSYTLNRTPKGLKGGVTQKSIATQRSIGKITEKKFVVLNLDRDGQLGVYGELKCEGKPCTTMVANVFAAWQGRWNVLRQATYWAYCPQAEAVGDPYFEVIPVDLKGDGRPAVFVQHTFYESWGISLFQYQGGRLIKLLEFGEGGV
jgi:hypothetical protein